MPGKISPAVYYFVNNLIRWCIIVCTLLSASRLVSTSNRVQSAMKFSNRLYRSSNSFAVIACRTAPNSSLSIFTNSFKGFQIATFGVVGVLCRINQRHIVCYCRPLFPGNGGRVSYFIMSVTTWNKTKIVNTCFRSHTILFFELPGKRPVVYFHATNIRIVFILPKELSFIFAYFFIFRNNRPKTTHLPTPSNSTNILPLRPLIHLPSERRTARHGIRRNSGRVNRSPK